MFVAVAVTVAVKREHVCTWIDVTSTAWSRDRVASCRGRGPVACRVAVRRRSPEAVTEGAGAERSSWPRRLDATGAVRDGYWWSWCWWACARGRRPERVRAARRM